VRAALVERGAPATLLKVVAYGESTPIASNATTAGRAANRRISFDWLP
jgi:outer membrane protein OmpA-like peptidoglycan-associated protein